MNIIKIEELARIGRVSQWIVRFEIDLTSEIGIIGNNLNEFNKDIKSLNLPVWVFNTVNPRFVYLGLNFGILSITEFD